MTIRVTLVDGYGNRSDQLFPDAAAAIRYCRGRRPVAVGVDADDLATAADARALAGLMILLMSILPEPAAAG